MRFAGQGYVAQSNSGGGPVHGDMRGRDWGGNPVGGAVHEPRIMKHIGTYNPLDQPAGLDPYQGMNKVEVAGGFNLLNPFTWHKTGEVRDRIQSGDPNLKFEEGALGVYGKSLRDRQRLLREAGML